MNFRQIFLALLTLINCLDQKQFINKHYARKCLEYKSKKTYYLFYNGQIEVHGEDYVQVLLQGSDLISL